MEHPKNFPNVPLEAIHHLPSAPGLYFALRDSDVLYIGQSQDIRGRWKNHHKLNELKEIGGVRIHFIPSDGRSLLEQEADWIGLLHPPLNNAGVSHRAYPNFPRTVTSLFYLYYLISIPGILLGMWGWYKDDVGMFQIGTIFLISGMFLYLGGSFVWWMVRNVYPRILK